uniref:Uncharacterized protein n=1 Tax=Oryza punctata TaxID=4537 RepID=A0A0E0KNI3_ORYPU
MKTQVEGLIEYYNHLESKMKALQLELDEAKATAKQTTDKAASTTRTLAQVTESAKQASYTLRRALNDLGVKPDSVPGRDAPAIDFTEWSQQAGGVVAQATGNYGDCCARVAASFVLSFLWEHGYEHITYLPWQVKGP